MIGAMAAFTAEPLAPEKLFNIGPLPVTNSMLTGVLSAIFVIALFGLAAKASKLWPKSRFAFAIESLIDFVDGLMAESFGDSKKARKHFPLLWTLLIFILIGNLTGLLPGMESIMYSSGGHHVSLFRSWTTDLNSTLAMAVLSLATVHYYAVKQVGLRGYARHFFSGKLTNPLTWFIGINELFSEILRLITLSLRLFGVIYGGETLLSAISALAGNFGWAATLPVIFLEIFVSLIQAYLFMMLTSSYIVMATSHGSEVEESHSAQPSPARS
jgi:F-type H+-transporting ATPase subunit a